jgi:hypothetical protein
MSSSSAQNERIELTQCFNIAESKSMIILKFRIELTQYFNIQCSLGLSPPVLSPNSPIANILVCPDFRHYKYPAILPNSATAIHHSFSDTKVVKSI